MTWNEIKALARELRKNQTEEEERLWVYLRGRRLNGVKFFRQHPIKYEQHGKVSFFIADFYSKEKNIVIELDGLIHQKQKAYDHQRDLILKDKKLRVLRIDNREFEDIGAVIDKIETLLTHP